MNASIVIDKCEKSSVSSDVDCSLNHESQKKYEFNYFLELICKAQIYPYISGGELFCKNIGLPLSLNMKDRIKKYKGALLEFLTKKDALLRNYEIEFLNQALSHVLPDGFILLKFDGDLYCYCEKSKFGGSVVIAPDYATMSDIQNIFGSIPDYVFHEQHIISLSESSNRKFNELISMIPVIPVTADEKFKTTKALKRL